MFKLNNSLITLVLVFFVFLLPNAQAANRYTVSANGQEVKDNKTQLIWRRCPWGMTWSVNLCHGTAATYTHEEALASYSDDTVWRLPNVKELSSIVDRNHSNPAIDTLIFPATPSSMFWSSTPYSTDANNAWHVDFYGGNVGVSVRYDNLMVRLVRSGQ